jgi:pantetheine-phosphate adenylyltransferase
MRTAVYPGSFDPVTLGHLDIVARAAGLFDRLLVAVLANPRKSPLFTIEERVTILRTSLAALPAEPRSRVEVTTFDGLTVELCRARGAGSIVRGLRVISDFELELQLAHNNRKLAPEIDTVFLMTALEHGYVSSTLVREIASFGGDVSAMVPPAAAAALRERAAR